MTAKYLLNGKPLEGTLDDFVMVNDFDEIEMTELLDLAPGDTYTGGGGAWATWTLQRVDGCCEACLAPDCRCLLCGAPCTEQCTGQGCEMLTRGGAGRGRR